MSKKIWGYMIAGCMSLAVIIMLGLNVMAADSTMPFATDKTDRTLLKEILVNQDKTLALLQEIKALVQAKK
jgi:hypothetical protein